MANLSANASHIVDVAQGCSHRKRSFFPAEVVLDPEVFNHQGELRLCQKDDVEDCAKLAASLCAIFMVHDELHFIAAKKARALLAQCIPGTIGLCPRSFKAMRACLAREGIMSPKGKKDFTKRSWEKVRFR